MGQRFIIGDTHFGDSAIIRYENRPFACVEEMDNTLIENWNAVVTAEDFIFVVGDFFSIPDETYIQSILSRLTGHIALVVGNHDTPRIQQILRQNGNIEIYPYPIIVDNFWILSHEPLYINSHMPYANLYGHVHNHPSYRDVSPQSLCVCAERLHYQPISIQCAKERILAAASL